MGDAEQESTRVAMRLYGLTDLEDARKIFRAAWRAGENWRASAIAYDGNQVVGVLQTGRSSVSVSFELVLTMLRTLGPMRMLRLPGRLRLQGRVSPKKPPAAFVVSELHVVPAMRGRGYGAAMLRHAERLARDAGCPSMALHTYTTNHAQHLYTRFGFEIAATVTDAAFERLTGTGGNVLMMKQLAQAGSDVALDPL